MIKILKVIQTKFLKVLESLGNALNETPQARERSIHPRQTPPWKNRSRSRHKDDLLPREVSKAKGHVNTSTTTFNHPRKETRH